MTAWLRERGLTSRDAGRLAATARRLAGLPVTRAAWADGTAAAMRTWRAHAAALADDLAPEEPARALHLSPSLDGRWVLDGDLDAESGQVVATAVSLATTPDVGGEPARTPAERRADALVDVCRFFLDHQHSRPAGRHRPHLNVVVDVDAVTGGGPAALVGGGPLPRAAIGRLACDSAWHRVLASRSAILDYGTATRSIPAPLWNALLLRDHHCRFPGCDRPSSWCEGHHLIPITEQGPTRLDNLALLCTRHHHRLHQPGRHAKLRPDATLSVTDPNGQVRTTRPPGPAP
jgi:hypothetical protein